MVDSHISQYPQVHVMHIWEHHYPPKHLIHPSKGFQYLSGSHNSGQEYPISILKNNTPMYICHVAW